ncbi:hypothetical protein MLD38_029505 [Melastoma candidum]|uniref:Uncharacterized protein n=1 Tax=Melastoma candidum TaxID=119954 RepID=A0ACB9N9P2_9MYRT|nr:hypothetical protein MLD38_029505 [Melastoma candidum]
MDKCSLRDQLQRQFQIHLSKLVLEALAGIFFYLVPSRIQSLGSRKGLAPLKDILCMPEDQAYRKPAQRQRILAPLSETTSHAHPQHEKQSEAKPLKIKSGSFKVPPAATKQKPFEEAGVCGFLRHDGSPALCQVQEQQGEIPSSR